MTKTILMEVEEAFQNDQMIESEPELILRLEESFQSGNAALLLKRIPSVPLPELDGDLKNV